MTAAAIPPSRALDLLRAARDRYGRSPEDWVTAALADVEGPVVELRCAPSSPTRRIALRSTAVGGAPGDGVSCGGVQCGGSLDGGPLDGGVLDGGVLGRPEQLPVRTNAVAGVRATMCLPALEGLDELFAELRRVLRPTGTLVALVPSRPGGPLTTPRAWRPLNRALAGHPGFRHASAQDHLGWLFTAADFAVLTDQRRAFWVPVPDEISAARVVAGLVPAGIWPPDVEPERLRRAESGLARYAAPDRRLPIPLRMLVGRR
jgi:SAM-dependent methyltransferase